MVIRLGEYDDRDVITTSLWTDYFPGGGTIVDGDDSITIPIG